MKDNDPTPLTEIEPQRQDRGDPRVFARVPVDLYKRIQAMRESYRNTPEGRPAQTSEVVRCLISEGEMLMDKSLRDRVAELRQEHRIATMEEAWREVIESGIAAMRENGHK